MKKMWCKLFGHSFKYNFPIDSQPYKRICKCCHKKEKLNIVTGEWSSGTFTDPRSDKVLIQKWFSKKTSRIKILFWEHEKRAQLFYEELLESRKNKFKFGK